MVVVVLLTVMWWRTLDARPGTPPAIKDEAPNPQPGDVWVNPRDGAEMVWIPGGEFLMGSSDEEIRALRGRYRLPNEFDGFDDEKPAHRVQVDGLWMYKHEVTVAQYRAFCEATGRQMPLQPEWNKDSHPVVNVSWEDATAYCEWAGVALPTEAQWEYAARGGRGYAFGTADGTLSHDLANYFGTGGRDRWENTSPVGSFPANPFGLHDLSGNVWEWCQDWYQEGFYAQCARQGVVRNPLCNENASMRVLRGGSWDDDPYYARAANRTGGYPVRRRVYHGVRGATARLE